MTALIECAIYPTEYGTIVNSVLIETVEIETIYGSIHILRKSYQAIETSL